MLTVEKATDSLRIELLVVLKSVEACFPLINFLLLHEGLHWYHAFIEKPFFVDMFFENKFVRVIVVIKSPIIVVHQYMIYWWTTAIRDFLLYYMMSSVKMHIMPNQCVALFKYPPLVENFLKKDYEDGEDVCGNASYTKFHFT